MILKTFFDKVKITKTKDTKTQFVVSILKLEENLVEEHDKVKLISSLGEVLKDAFILINELKLAINNKEIPDWDLDNWKDNIKQYRAKTEHTIADVFLYSIRNSLKNILLNQEEAKIYLFEIIIKTFLFIDSINFSIDGILEEKLKELKKD